MRTIKYPDGITEWQNPLRAYPQRGDLLQGIHDLLFKITDFSTVIPWAVMILTKLMVVPHYSEESSLIPTYGIFVNFPLVLMGCTKWEGDHLIYKIKSPMPLFSLISISLKSFKTDPVFHLAPVVIFALASSPLGFTQYMHLCFSVLLLKQYLFGWISFQISVVL